MSKLPTRRTHLIGLLLGAAMVLPATTQTASADTAAIRTAIVAVMAANKCSTAERQLVAGLKQRSITVKTAFPVLKTMISEGVARRANGRVALSKKVCPPKAATVAAPAPTVTSTPSTPTVAAAPTEATKPVFGNAQTAATSAASVSLNDGETRFVDAILTHGCRLNTHAMLEVARRGALTPPQMQAMGADFVKRGLATFTRRTLVLGDRLCPAVDVAKDPNAMGWAALTVPASAPAQLPPPALSAPPVGVVPADPAAQILDLARANGCVLTGALAESQLPALGIPLAMGQDIVGGWLDRGEATLGEGDSITLGPVLCGTAGANTVQADARALYDAVAEAGCFLTVADAEVRLPALGFNLDTVPALADQLVAEGAAAFEQSANGQGLRVFGGRCG
ncbi:MAG: hypothetical protein AAF318_01740 [Pseudomonadota bacterium]